MGSGSGGSDRPARPREPQCAAGRPAAMRRALIAFGTLGGGTLIAFVLAGLAFLAAPDGRLVPASNNWPIAIKGGPAPAPAILVDPAVPAPVPMPAVVEDAVVVGGAGVAPAVPADGEKA